MVLQIRQYKHVSIDDLESPVEHIHHVSDRQILGSVEFGVVDVATWFGNPGSRQELASSSTRVARGLFVDHEGVGSKTEVDYELAISVCVLVILILEKNELRTSKNDWRFLKVRTSILKNAAHQY